MITAAQALDYAEGYLLRGERPRVDLTEVVAVLRASATVEGPTDQELYRYQWDRWAVYSRVELGTQHCGSYLLRCVFELGQRWHIDGPAELERAAAAAEPLRHRANHEPPPAATGEMHSCTCPIPMPATAGNWHLSGCPLAPA